MRNERGRTGGGGGGVAWKACEEESRRAERSKVKKNDGAKEG